MGEDGHGARPAQGTDLSPEVLMSRSTYRSKVWKPFRESAIVGVLCIMIPSLLVGQVIGLLYPAPLA